MHQIVEWTAVEADDEDVFKLVYAGSLDTAANATDLEPKFFDYVVLVTPTK